MRSPAVGAAGALFALSAAVAPAHAEVIEFDGEPAPVPYFLHAKYFLYVGAEPAKLQVQASIGGGGVEDYAEMYMALMPYEADAPTLAGHCAPVKPPKTGNELRFPNGASASHVVSFSLPYGRLERFTAELPQQGPWAVAFANCGAGAGLTISGNLTTRTRREYLGGHEQAAVSTAAALAACSAAACALWLWACGRSPRALCAAHGWIGAVSAMGALTEALCAARALADSMGVAQTAALCCAADAASVMRVACTWAMLPRLAPRSSSLCEVPLGAHGRHTVILCLYALAHIPLTCVLHQRWLHGTPAADVAASGVPAATGALIAFACFAKDALPGLGRRQDGGRGVATATIVGVYACLCAIAASALLADGPGGGPDSWAFHLFADGVASQACHLFLVCGLMLWWRPSSASGPARQYSAAGCTDDEHGPDSPEGQPSGAEVTCDRLGKKCRGRRGASR